MQVVSGRIDRPLRALRSPAARRSGGEHRRITSPGSTPAGWTPRSIRMLRAAIAHFWFITLHPFDDGNGRLTRALTDLALAQGDAAEHPLLRHVGCHPRRTAQPTTPNSTSRAEDAGHRRCARSHPLAFAWFQMRTLLAAIHAASAQIDLRNSLPRAASERPEPRAAWACPPSRRQSTQPPARRTTSPVAAVSSQGIERRCQYQAVAKVSKAYRHPPPRRPRRARLPPSNSPAASRSTRYRILWSQPTGATPNTNTETP